MMTKKQCNKLVAFVDRYFTWDERVYENRSVHFTREDEVEKRITVDIDRYAAFVIINGECDILWLDSFAKIREFKALVRELG